MAFLKWYKRDPRAALVGMAGLTLEERGAYNTILDLIYCHEGGLPDDVRTVAHLMQVDLRTWKRLRERLLDLGKLYTSCGQLRNERADQEVTSAELRHRCFSELARKRWGYPIKTNGLHNANAYANHNHIDKEESLPEKAKKALERLRTLK